MSKLTKEQLEFVKARKASLEEQLSQNKGDLRSSDKLALFSGQNYDYLQDYSLRGETQRFINEIASLDKVISESEVIEDDSEKIGLGTKFVATLTEEGKESKTSKYILFGQAQFVNLDDFSYAPVSVNAPFGKAILDKGEGDEVSFITPDKKRVHAIVDEIIPNKEKTNDVKVQVKK